MLTWSQPQGLSRGGARTSWTAETEQGLSLGEGAGLMGGEEHQGDVQVWGERVEEWERGCLVVGLP